MQNKSKNNNKFKGHRSPKQSSEATSQNCNESTSNIDPNSYNGKEERPNSKHFNDPDWYVNSEQILKDAARLPYSLPVGTCYRRDGFSISDDEHLQPSEYDMSIPGLMVSYLMPTLGATDQSQNAPLNIAANSLFQFVRSKISGSRKYEAVDMMLYMGAMDSIFCRITWMTRLYATAYTYHQANKYLARELVEAQDVDYDDLVANLPQFRAQLNVELTKVKAMYLPSVLPIFKRHSWMFSHYFIEGDSMKDQIYFHTPAGYHYFTLDGDGKGALSAVCTCHPSRKFTVADLIQSIRQMINPIFEREDFNIISGDMLKAYAGKVFSLTELPDIATVQFAYAPDVLLQFKNAKYKNIPNQDNSPFDWDKGFFNYSQNSKSQLVMSGNQFDNAKKVLRDFMWVDIGAGNRVVKVEDDSWSATFSQSKAVMYEWSKDTLLTTPSHDVEPVENMINTRLTLAFNFKDISETYLNKDYDMSYFGSEWPVYYKLISFHRRKSTGVINALRYSYDRCLVVSNSEVYILVEAQIPVRSAFKYLPELTILKYNYNSSDNTAVVDCTNRSLFEVDNYTLVSAEIINGLHGAALLGEYDIPKTAIEG